MALKTCSEATWQEIGKFRCVTKRLDSCQDDFSEVQRERYVHVLEEMSKKGWKKRTTTTYKYVFCVRPWPRKRRLKTGDPEQVNVQSVQSRQGCKKIYEQVVM